MTKKAPGDRTGMGFRLGLSLLLLVPGLPLVPRQGNSGITTPLLMTMVSS